MSEEQDYGAVITERTDKAKALILDLVKDNPLLGKGPDEMRCINERNVHYQDALREGIIAAIVTRSDPVAGFTAAMTALIIALGRQDSEQSREAIGYLIGLKEAIENVEGGPLAILNGELSVECLLRPGDTPTEEQREHFGLPEGPVAAGSTVKIKREGNVVDATEAFAARGGKPTVH